MPTSMTFDAPRYWDGKAAEVDFTHPLYTAWLSGLSKDARILDYGCGYGRTLAQLWDTDWRNSIGVDFSRAMIARGRREFPHLDLRLVEASPLVEPDASFDAVVLFAVLTTITAEDVEQAVMVEAARLLRPGGLLYLSDYLLQADPRYIARYEEGARRHGAYGVWDREDGGMFRHRSRDHLMGLLQGFDVIAEREAQTTTLSGAPARAFQVLARRARG